MRSLPACLALALVTSASTQLSAHEGEGVPPLALSPVVSLGRASTGEGAWKFETVPDWGAPPDQKPLGPTHGGVAVDKAGNVYISTDGERGIVVCDKDGKYLRSIATEFRAIHGLNVREENGGEFLYAAWLAGAQALKLKLDGTAVLKLPVPLECGHYKDAKQYKPTSVACAPDGSIFVADGYGLSLIHKYDATGKWLKTFGGKGTEDGKFQTCHGLGIDLRGAAPRLLVCDRENRRLVHLTLEGEFLATVATGLRRPCAVSFSGRNFAIAELEARVTIFDGDNREVAHLGDNPDHSQWAQFPVPPDRWQAGIFTAPHGLSWDDAGNLYVQDWNATGRLTCLRPVKAG